jgi:hypothetical protein
VALWKSAKRQLERGLANLPALATAHSGAPSQSCALGMLVFTLFLLLTFAPAQDNSATPASEFMRRIVAKELKAEAQDHSHWMVRQQTEKPGSQTEVDEVIETSSGDLTYPILINGQPLSPEQQKRADQHIRQLIHNPGALEKSPEGRK